LESRLFFQHTCFFNIFTGIVFIPPKDEILKKEILFNDNYLCFIIFNQFNPSFMNIKRNPAGRLVYWVVVFASVFYGCKKYIFDEITLKPEFGIRLFNGTVSLTDIMNYENDSLNYLYEGEDNLMYLHFEKNLTNKTTKDFFRSIYEKDTIIDYTIPLDFVEFFYEIETSLNAKVPFVENFNIYKIDSIRLDSCLLMIELIADANNFDTLSLEIPSFFYSQGDPVLIEFSREEYQAQKTVDLTNGTLYLEPTNFSSGLVDIKLHLKFSKKGEISVKIPTLKMYLYDLRINSIHGRFGNRLEPIEESVPLFDSLPIFEEYIQNEAVFLDINNPEIYLFFKNGFNFPFVLQNLNLQAGTPYFKEEIRGLPHSVYVEAGNNGNLGYGQEKFSYKTNIENVLGRMPDNLYFSGEIVLNPEDRETLNSITKNDTLFLGIKGDIPLNLQVSEIVFRQVVDSVNLENILNDFVEAVKFNASFKNNLPVNISAQIFFINETGLTVSQAFKEPLEIQSGNQDAEQYFETELSNEFEGEELDAIRNSKLLVELKFLTAINGQSSMVRFLSTQNISFDFYVFGKTKFEINNE
jgi:hypothetical protein